MSSTTNKATLQAQLMATPEFSALNADAAQAVLFLMNNLDLGLELDTEMDGETTRVVAFAELTLCGVSVSKAKSSSWVSNPNF